MISQSRKTLCPMLSQRRLPLFAVLAGILATTIVSYPTSSTPRLAADHAGAHGKGRNGSHTYTLTGSHHKGDNKTDTGRHSQSVAAVVDRPAKSVSYGDDDGSGRGGTGKRGKGGGSGEWYNTAGWLPAKGPARDHTVNLTVLPMLAFACLVFGVCLKCYSWMRDQDRTKARGQLDFEDADEVNYTIITVGEQGYREVDIRSDSTSIYDTLTSFRSLRLPLNDHTVTSVKSLPSQPYKTYRSIVLKKGEEGVYDSVHSYRAFLQRTAEMGDLDIEVEELVSEDPPRPRSKSCEFSSDGASLRNGRSRRRRPRRHSGGRGIEGGVRVQAEKGRERDRFRRHSDRSTPHPRPQPEGFQGKAFHRRSSPAILEPLPQGAEFKIPLGLSEDEEGERAEREREEGLGGEGSEAPPVPPCLPTLHRSSSPSSSSSDESSGADGGGAGSRRAKGWRERRRPRRGASQDRLSQRLVKGSSHSSGHCSDDSPRSSLSSPHPSASSNDLDSDSEVTDSGAIMDAGRSARPGCFKQPGHIPQVSPDRNLDLHANSSAKKVHRFKVSFVDDTSLPASSD